MITRVASVYPITMHTERGIYGGVFHLPAYKKDSPPVIIDVKDHVQIDTLPWIMAPTGASRQSQAKIKIDSLDIARDIVREWTLTTLGQAPDCRPGIWVVRDRIPEVDETGKPVIDAMGIQEWRPASREEKAQMFEEDLAHNLAAQSTWANYCITAGDIMGENIKAIPYIPTYCKILCRYYGRDRKWLHELKDGDIKNCQFCKKDIPIDAIKCQFCQEVVDRKAYNALVGDNADKPTAKPPKPLSVRPEDVRKVMESKPAIVEVEPEVPEPSDVSDMILDANNEDWQAELAAVGEAETEPEPVHRGPGRPRKNQ